MRRFYRQIIDLSIAMPHLTYVVTGIWLKDPKSTRRQLPLQEITEWLPKGIIRLGTKKFNMTGFCPQPKQWIIYIVRFTKRDEDLSVWTILGAKRVID